MTCKRCTPDPDNKAYKITDLKYNPQVTYNDFADITVTIKRVGWLSDKYCRVCLYEGNTQFMDSGSLTLTRGETFDVQFQFHMPNRNLNLRASLIEESLGFVETCRDAKDFSVLLAPAGEPTIPPTPPTPPPGDDDDNPLDSLQEWIEQNPYLVFGFLALIGIALITRS